MKRNMIGIITLAVALLPLWLSGTAQAKSGYLTSFNSTYPSAPAAIKNCVLCHPGGNTKSFNPYALDYKAAGYSFSAIESKDSDGDGATNITEINAGTYPGDPASKPVTAPPPPAAPSLSGLSISGPTSLNESGIATYAATASWSDGSTSPTTPTWSENSAYATIDASGVLTASAVTANQSVTVAASYTSGGVTKTASKVVTIVDVPVPAPAPAPAPAPSPTPTPVSGQTVFESKCAGCHTLTGTSIMNLAGDGAKVATSHKISLLTAEEAVALAAYLDAQAAPAPAPAPDPTPAPPVGNGDTDGDGMPDSFEVTNGFDYTNAGDAMLDADGDGLTNLMEYQRGTSPRNPDTDGDGVWDGTDQAPLDANRPRMNMQGRALYGFWYLDNGNFSWDQGMDAAYTGFGAPLDRPVTGDWNGDGKSQVGTYRQGQWFLDNGNGQWDAGIDTAFANFGAADDIPVTGDWNGNGKSQVGTYRRGTWYLDNGNGQWDGPGVDTVHANFGAPDDIPVTGDWNGDGKSQVGTYRQGTWFLDNGNGQWDAGIDKVCHFGTSGDIPVTGDWNGDGKSQIGVYRQGTLYLDTNGNGEWDPGIDEVHNAFGSPTDTPVSGDWNGDGKSQIGMWR